jgi:hypothetical protein
VRHETYQTDVSCRLSLVEAENASLLALQSEREKERETERHSRAATAEASQAMIMFSRDNELMVMVISVLTVNLWQDVLQRELADKTQQLRAALEVFETLVQSSLFRP